MEYNGEFNPWPDETSMPKLSAEVYPDGDFYLTAGEKKLLAQVEEVYDKIVVVLNIGGVIDLSWIKRDDKIGAALYPHPPEYPVLHACESSLRCSRAYAPAPSTAPDAPSPIGLQRRQLPGPFRVSSASQTEVLCATEYP